MENNSKAGNNQPKFCRYCGTRLVEGAQFCKNCGKRIIYDKTQSNPAPISNAVLRQNTVRLSTPDSPNRGAAEQHSGKHSWKNMDSKKKKRWIAVISIVMVFVILAVVLCSVFVGKKNSDVINTGAAHGGTIDLSKAVYAEGINGDGTFSANFGNAEAIRNDFFDNYEFHFSKEEDLKNGDVVDCVVSYKGSNKPIPDKERFEGYKLKNPSFKLTVSGLLPKNPHINEISDHTLKKFTNKVIKETLKRNIYYVSNEDGESSYWTSMDDLKGLKITDKKAYIDDEDDAALLYCLISGVTRSGQHAIIEIVCGPIVNDHGHILASNRPFISGDDLSTTNGNYLADISDSDDDDNITKLLIPNRNYLKLIYAAVPVIRENNESDAEESISDFNDEQKDAVRQINF